jgi:hypothetical protein
MRILTRARNYEIDGSVADPRDGEGVETRASFQPLLRPLGFFLLRFYPHKSHGIRISESQNQGAFAPRVDLQGHLNAIIGCTTVYIQCRSIQAPII